MGAFTVVVSTVLGLAIFNLGIQDGNYIGGAFWGLVLAGTG